MLPSELIKYKEKSQKIIALTAWDSISASIAEQADVDIVLKVILSDGLLGIQIHITVNLRKHCLPHQCCFKRFKRELKNNH